MSVKVPTTVLGLSWSRLNEALLECDDLIVLQRWMEEAIAGSDTLGRVLRIHSRLNVVRNAKEVKALKSIVAQTAAVENRARNGEAAK
jgi:hypothetical protein